VLNVLTSQFAALNAVIDGIRIREIMSSYPLQTSETLSHHLDINIPLFKISLALSKIEQLISEKGPTHVLKQCRKHNKQLLRDQDNQRLKNYIDEKKLA
jgi:hypothetical protein